MRRCCCGVCCCYCCHAGLIATTDCDFVRRCGGGRGDAAVARRTARAVGRGFCGFIVVAVAAITANRISIMICYCC